MAQRRAGAKRSVGNAPKLTRRQQKRVQQRQRSSRPATGQAQTAPASPPEVPTPAPVPARVHTTRASAPSAAAPTRAPAPDPVPASELAPTKPQRPLRASAPQPQAQHVEPPRAEKAHLAASRKGPPQKSAPPADDEASEPSRRFPTLATMAATAHAAGDTEGNSQGDGTEEDYAAADADANDVARPSPNLNVDMSLDARPYVDTRPEKASPLAVPPMASATRQSRPLSVVPFVRAAATKRAAARERSAAASGDLPRPQRLLRSRPAAHGLPPADTLLPAAGIHTAVAVVGALSGAVLLLARQPVGLWPLTLAIVTGIGGWLANSLAQRSREGAVFALATTDVGVLIWLLALVGPRISLLFLVPGLALFALQLAGRPRPAGVVMVASVAAYVVCAALSYGGLLRPMLTFSDVTGAVFDGALACLGLLLFFRLALAAEARRHKAEALAAARSYELGAQRARNQALRRQVETDAERLHDALHDALRGRPHDPVEAEGPLSPLAEEVELIASRMAALQRDREARRQTESAIRRLTRVLERAWLGLPWEWPEPSGTELDEVVALLRSPNPRETARARLDENSGLLPIPTLDPQHVPPAWAPPQPHRLAPLAEPNPLWSSGELHATRPLARERHEQQSSLPWDEWDDWRGWDAEG